MTRRNTRTSLAQPTSRTHLSAILRYLWASTLTGLCIEGDAVAYKQYSISNMTGFGADVSHEVKSWATYQYDCKALEYVDSDGVKHNPCVEKELTVAQAIALGLVS